MLRIAQLPVKATPALRAMDLTFVNQLVHVRSAKITLGLGMSYQTQTVISMIVSFIQSEFIRGPSYKNI